MPATLDSLMETASRALAEMDYARCESLCLQAFEQARSAGDWVMVQRVLLPLQEARRQKRQAATDGLILLGTPEADRASLTDLIADSRCGCVVLTHPLTADDAAELDTAVRNRHRAIELLFADNPADAETWRITALRRPAVVAELTAPEPAWVGEWIDPLATAPPTPAHWFMRASEALGDAALEAVTAPPGSEQRFDQLAEALASAGDHEILHQRLADAARALHEAQR